MLPPKSEWFRLGRAALAGAAATLADLAVLALLVSGAGFSPRFASIPALLVGGVVNFWGNRNFAFRARHGSLARQALLYTLVELVALALNGVLYDGAMRALTLQAAHAPGSIPAWAYVAARLISSNLVFIAWSYPLWRGVFRTRQAVATT